MGINGGTGDGGIKGGIAVSCDGRGVVCCGEVVIEVWW